MAHGSTEVLRPQGLMMPMDDDARIAEEHLRRQNSHGWLIFVTICICGMAYKPGREIRELSRGVIRASFDLGHVWHFCSLHVRCALFELLSVLTACVSYSGSRLWLQLVDFPIHLPILS